MVADKEKIFSAIQPVIKDFSYVSPHSHNGYENENNIQISRNWNQNKIKAAELCNRKWGGEYRWNNIMSLTDALNDCHGMDVLTADKKIRDLYTSNKFNRKVLPRILIELIRQNGNSENLYISLHFGGQSIKTFEKITGENPFENILHDINELIYQIRYNSDVIPE